jgi:hypothetical protein
MKKFKKTNSFFVSPSQFTPINVLKRLSAFFSQIFAELIFISLKILVKS